MYQLLFLPFNLQYILQEPERRRIFNRGKRSRKESKAEGVEGDKISERHWFGSSSLSDMSVGIVGAHCLQNFLPVSLV